MISLPYATTFIAIDGDESEVHIERIAVLQSDKDGALGKPKSGRIGGLVERGEMPKALDTLHAHTDLILNAYRNRVSSVEDSLEMTARAYADAFLRLAIVSLLPHDHALSVRFWTWLATVGGGANSKCSALFGGEGAPEQSTEQRQRFD